MVIQHANVKGEQIEPLLDAELDAELNGGKKDFAMNLDLEEYGHKISSGDRIFIADTEIGGLVKRIKVDTATNTLTIGGYTWRGMLDYKVIVPPKGYDHYVVNGELNEILRSFIEPAFSGLFKVPAINTGVTVTNFKFDRFCTFTDGFTKMLKSKGYRIEIKYNEGQSNGSGWIDICAVPIRDLSKHTELSQDSKLNFTISKVDSGVNHLIVAGKGDMQAREVFHLYVQKDGTIGDTKYYTGLDEIEKVYEDTSTDSADLRNRAIDKLKTLMNKEKMKMDVEELKVDAEIGDIIGGRDYITGIAMKKPLENIIVKVKNGELIKEYKLEGENA